MKRVVVSCGLFLTSAVLALLLSSSWAEEENIGMSDPLNLEKADDKRYMRFGKRPRSTVWSPEIDQLLDDLLSENSPVSIGDKIQQQQPSDDSMAPMEADKRYMRFGRRHDGFSANAADRYYTKFGKRYMRFGRSADNN